ncbi:MAG TPA: cytochrome c oxidase subunit II [Solirubrobacteraceae bacterium]
MRAPRRHKGLLVAFAAAVVATLALAPAALAGVILPEHGGSPNADRINTLYTVVLVLAAIIFVGVEGALIYSMVRFRARKGAVAAQIRGNTRLEVGWTIGAAALIVILAGMTFALLPGIREPENSDANGFRASNGGILYAAGPVKRLPPNGKALNICVNGQQYLWRYTYGARCKDAPLNSVFSYETMVVPTGTTVTLDIVAQDVAHSWWIPELGGKFDAIPGYTNYTWFKVPHGMEGRVFRGQCAELCGRNHANMIAHVKAVSPADFEQFLASKKAQIEAADAGAAASRQRLDRNPQANP